jgi:hypothetical protein
MPKPKLKTGQIEAAVARHLNPRTNLIVPNVHWGMNIHECDLLVITKSGYAWEVEIKVTKADLKKDAEKRHQHQDDRIKALFFAIPDYLQDCIDLIPERAGILIVRSGDRQTDNYGGRKYTWPRRVTRLREPVQNLAARPFSDDERYKVARLGALRIWLLKEKLHEI